MRVYISCGEAYPIYDISPLGEIENNNDVDVDRETLLKWKKTFDDFYEMQKEIGQIAKSQGKDHCNEDDLNDLFSLYMIEGLGDLKIKPKDKEEDIDIKVQDGLGISLLEMKEYLSNELLLNADTIAKDLINIAPLGDYDKLMENAEEMADFLKTEGIKTEHWKLAGVKDIQDQMLQFRFLSKAVDQGDTFEGFVVVSFNGSICHAFCQGDI